MNARFVEVIEAFARSLGVSGYSGAGQDVLAIDLERSGRFCIEAVDEDVLVYLIRGYGPSLSGVARQALMACHHRERHAWPVSTALIADDQLLFSIRLPLARADVPELAGSLRTLNDLHDRLGAGA